MILTGIGDEAGANIDAQIRATQELGWKYIEMRAVEVPGFPKGNFHDIPEDAFNLCVEKLQQNGIGVYAFGSAIANWAKTIETSWEITAAEVKRCIPRMQKLGTKFVRIMSFKPKDNEDKIPAVVFERIGEVTKMFLDAGLQPVHENCMNYGGMSWKHGLELLEKCPGLKWVFDTGNPIFNNDRSKSKPWSHQDPWEYWVNLRGHTAHIHVKDATTQPGQKEPAYNYPGEGQARVRDILKDALARGYDAGISIEPHVAVVFHDASVQADDKLVYESYIKYGRQLEKMIAEIKTEQRQKTNLVEAR
ncbi:MAG: sugar phosphate isomerase/epimerase [Verrucomicrobiota bacterium]|nr:sugar phosphate isomerase/epimerase [Verrucomicrobiota bacterium]